MKLIPDPVSRTFNPGHRFVPNDALGYCVIDFCADNLKKITSLLITPVWCNFPAALFVSAEIGPGSPTKTAPTSATAGKIKTPK
ncbi:MAG: hypothetical protein CMM47_03970 [Rhodospirillaceae bacterium]|nr:hypothetical protein [Rhodospirillaceae bacterium]